eukprot:sb/3472913/
MRSQTQVSITISQTYHWTAVERGVKIPWDLEGTPLQIKTNSTLDSGDQVMRMQLYDKNNSQLGTVGVKFSSPMQYRIGHCIEDWEDLLVQPTVEVEKILTIIKTKTALIIICNNVEVMNYLFADSSNGECVQTKQGDVVDQLKFSKQYDTSSDFYRSTG